MTTSILMIAVAITRSFRCQETKHALKRTFIQENAYIILNSFTWLFFGWKTSIISDSATRLRLIQTRNYQLLNTWHENFDF